LGAISETATHMSLHTAAPDASGSNESTANREPIELVLDNDELTVSNVSFTGGAANGPVTHVGFWTAATGGDFIDAIALSGASDGTFNALGEYIIDSVTITGT